jgi:hypothetical protein
MLPLLKKDPKALATIILERHYGENGKASDGDAYTSSKDGVDQDYEAGKDALLDDLWSAVESKDKSGFKSALSDLISLCMDNEESKEDATEEATEGSESES